MVDHARAVLVQYLQDRKRQSDRILPIVSHHVDVDDSKVKAAEDMAAQLFGAEYTFFLTNGSTQGIHGLMMAACRPGDKIIIPRNAHRSVLGGLILSGAVPVFVNPVYDYDWGFPLQVQVSDIGDALSAHPDARAVLLVNPSYQGMAVHMKEMAVLCHSYDIPLLVDEAHGPHFGFVSSLPCSSLHGGADGVVQSTHKLIGALTQSSMVHIQGNVLNRERLDQVFRLLRPNPASLLLLASLDGARRQMALEGSNLLSRTVALGEYVRKEIVPLSGLESFDKCDVLNKGVFDFDSTKVTVNVSALGVTGPEADRFLRHECSIQAEFSDLNNLLFMLTLGDSEHEINALLGGLRRLHDRYSLGSGIRNDIPILRTGYESAMSVQQAFFSEMVMRPLASSVGEISQTVLCPYPPGIPTVYPGERISADIRDYLIEVWKSKIPVLGIEVVDGTPHIPIVTRTHERGEQRGAKRHRT